MKPWVGLIFCLYWLGCRPGPASTRTEVSDTTQIVQENKPEIINEKVDPLPEDWIDISVFIPDVEIDIRYATTDNFVGEVMYECGRCLLQADAARALLTVQNKLLKKGLHLKLFDCYRPLPVQRRLWEKVPDINYVAPPDKGSMHNRGIAVDLTIVDEGGTDLEMGTAYDFFGPEAHHTYTDLSDEVLENRQFLKGIMESNGFQGIRTEWWHYSLKGSLPALSEYEWPCP